jgi:hypothetical protein
VGASKHHCDARVSASNQRVHEFDGTLAVPADRPSGHTVATDAPLRLEGGGVHPLVICVIPLKYCSNGRTGKFHRYWYLVDPVWYSY